MNRTYSIMICILTGVFLCGCPAPEIPASFFQVQASDVIGANEDNEDAEVTDAPDTAVEDADAGSEENSDTLKLDTEDVGEEEPECSTIQDCIGEVPNPCTQPTCLAGKCGEVPVQVGTECPLTEGNTAVCASATCNSIGECVETFEEAGKSCAEEGSVEQCSSATCDGTGVCAANNINEGQRCGSEEACLLSFCTSGECVQSPDLCEDRIDCTTNRCREIQCSDETLSNCEVQLRVKKEDGQVVEASANFSCPAAIEVNSDAPSCEGQCGGESFDFGCWCDDVCITAGDCCEDVCEHCGEIPHCVAQQTCNMTVCKPTFIGTPGADDIGCVSFSMTRAEVAAGVQEEGFGCGPSPIVEVCDDENSCTVETCNPNAIPGTDGCEQLVKGVADYCTGIETCSGVANCVLDPTVEAGVSCLVNNGGGCASSDPCVLSECNSLTGECVQQAAFSPGETLFCPAVEGDSEPCTKGSCVACEDGQPNCDIAECVAKSPYGFPCTNDENCKSQDGFVWKCLGDPGSKVCSLPCSDATCKECMNTNDFRGFVFESCADTCGATDDNLSIDDTFLPNLGGVLYDECLHNKIIGSTQLELDDDLEVCLESVELDSSVAQSLFGASMYSCGAANCAGAGSAPLCFCDDSCLSENFLDCCPNACSDCEVGAVPNPVGPGLCFELQGVTPEWLTADAIGFKSDNCTDCMATAAAIYIVTNCGSACNQCQELAPAVPNGAPPVCGRQSGGNTPFSLVTTCVQPCPAEVGSPATQCTGGDCSPPPSITIIP